MREIEPLTLEEVDRQIESIRQREAQGVPEGKHQPTVGDLLYVRRGLERDNVIKIGKAFLGQD